MQEVGHCSSRCISAGVEERGRRVAVDVVLDHRAVQDDDADNLDIDPHVRFDRRRFEERHGTLLCERPEAHRDHVTDVLAQRTSGVRGEDHLIGATRIRHTPLDCDGTILLEEETVRAAVQPDGGEEAETRPCDPNSNPFGTTARLDSLHVRQV